MQLSSLDRLEGVARADSGPALYRRTTNFPTGRVFIYAIALTTEAEPAESIADGGESLESLLKSCFVSRNSSHGLILDSTLTEAFIFATRKSLVVALT